MSRTIGSLCLVAMALALGACERRSEAPVTTPGESLEFQGSWNAVGTRHTISLGADRKSSTVDLRGTMLLSGKDRPDVGFEVEVIALTDSETGLVGRAVWTDEHGDQVFSEIKGEGTKQKNHITGTILSGTGRYAGVTGTYEFSWQFMIEAEDGSIQGRPVDLKGRIRSGQPPAGGATR